MSAVDRAGEMKEQDLLKNSEVIAVVGLSTNPLKDSQIVAGHMQRNGYRIIPVHPRADSILGETAYPSLSDIPPGLASEVDIVNVFRPSEEVPDLVREAIDHLPNLKGIWTQKAIVHEEALEYGQAQGVTMVMDRCIRTQLLFSRFALEE